MCVAVPMQVMRIEGETAVVDIGGTVKTVRLDLLDPKPRVGEYVIVHAGFAIHVIDEDEARISLDYFKELAASDAETSQ